VKAGNVPLPGVSVTASNSLTGKKYSTTTDVTGAYTLVIPQNGRYVLKTELSAFAPVTQPALLNATAHDLTVDFSIMLASRAEQQEQQTNLAGAARQLLGGGWLPIPTFRGRATQSPSPAKPVPPIRSPASTSDACATARSSMTPSAATEAPEGKLALVAEAQVEEAEALEEVASAAVADVAAEEACAATSATSNPTNPTAPSSGTAATAH